MIKKYMVNWSVAGAIEIKAKDDQNAWDIVECMTAEQIKEIVLREISSFEISSTEESELIFTEYTIEEFNKERNLDWGFKVNTEDFLEYLEESSQGYMYAAYDKEEVIEEYKEYLADMDDECELICIDGLYIALYL